MAVRSRDLVGIAEGIRNNELSTRGQIENLKGHISELSGRKNSLDSKISYLEATIAAVYENTDDDGEPDYGLLAILESERISADNELWDVEQDLDSSSNELESKQEKLKDVEEEKAQTLFEIQERARKTSQNISLAGGMYGAYSGVGVTLKNSLQTSLSSLTQAAGILGGHVDGGTGGRSGSATSGRSGTASRGIDIATGNENKRSDALIGFTGRYTGESLPLSASQFNTEQDQFITPATTSNYRLGKEKINTKPVQNFASRQDTNTYTINSFGKVLEESPVLPGVTEYLSGQESQDIYCAFKNMENDIPMENIENLTNIPMIARHGRNMFVDSLIVQDWELGRYSDFSMSLYRKKRAQTDYEAYIKAPDQYTHISCEKKQVIYIDPATIHEIRGIDDPHFWSYKGTAYSDYIDMARQIPLVYSMAKAGHKLTELAKREDVVGACVRNYFLNDDITVTRVGNGYIFGEQGRHRIMAALIAGVNVPVHLTDELIKIDDSSFVSEVTDKTGKALKYRKEFAKRSVTVSQKIACSDKNELETLVKSEGIASKVDFGEMDIRIAREFVDTIWNIKNKYQILKFAFIGASQVLNDNVEKNMRINLMRLYIQNNPGISIEEISANVEAEVNTYMKKLAVPEDNLASSVIVKRPQKIKKPKPGMEYSGEITEYVGDTVTSGFNGISINISNAKSYEKLCATLLEEEQCGYSPKGCKSIKYLVCHEIAHQLDNVLNLSKDPVIIKEYEKHKKMSEKEQINNLCVYASKSIEEFVAEAWAESQCSASPRYVAKLISNKVTLAMKTYIDSKKEGEDDEYVREL